MKATEQVTQEGPGKPCHYRNSICIVECRGFFEGFYVFVSRPLSSALAFIQFQ